MKKITLTLASLSTLLLPVMALAVSAGSPPDNAINSIQSLINSIQSLMWMAFGGIAVIMFVIAGIKFLTAGGEPEKVQEARGAFMWGVIGIVVGIVAYSIVAVVRNFVGA